MRVMKALSFAFVLGVLMTLVSPGARADAMDQDTHLTFSAPVELPGMVLLPGRYVLRLVEPYELSNVVEVLDSNGHVVDTIEGILTYRMKVTNKPVVTLEKRGPYTPEAIKSWFYPDMNYGLEFVYPKESQTGPHGSND